MATAHTALRGLLAGLVITASGAVGHAEIIAHYTFDDAANLFADATSYGNHGSVRTSDPSQNSGNAAVGSGALDLDGNDSVNIDVVRDDLSASAHSVALWVYSATNGGQRTLVARNTSSGGNGMLLFARDNVFQIHSDPPGVFVGVGSTQITAETPTAWHHLVYVRDGTTGRIYVDGVLDDSSFSVGYSFSPADQWSLGQEFDGSNTSDFFTGLLDDVQIYNNALSAADALWLFENPGGVVPEPSTFAMLAGLSVGGLALLVRRRRAS